LRSLNENTLLVSGDPWESYLASLILRKITSRYLPIQVQLHADVGSSSWRNMNWRNQIRSFFLSYSLNRAEIIRCVSESQLTNLERISPGVSSKTEVIPVPIKIDPNLSQKRKSHKNISIAIVGRIHKDRGLEEFVRICKILRRNFQELKIFIVGEGPHEDWLKNSLGKANLLQCSLFMGYRNQEELSFLWETFGCLASLAPSEAFGRSAREALMYGVPVLAKRSSGLSELETSYSGNGIWFVDRLSENQISNLFDDMAGFVVPNSIGKAIIKEVKSLHEELAKSWIEGSKLNRKLQK
jgi:glycosyltransferase involved in cell wall biosynthesis